ncbi:MAG: HAD family phosphatase [Nitrospirae bacterium]|nr:MAG: HAD family phosphatase [Nitrospirota bacterium]
MSAVALRAIIFDFNGVLADDETPHFLAFQQALAEDGLALTQEAYYGAYLGMDERNCAAALLDSAGGGRDLARLRKIMARKATLFQAYTATHKPPLFEGAVEFVKQAGARYRLAIASGGKREEIEFALRETPIEKDFTVIVSAEDTLFGKPDPAIYRLALARLNAAPPRPRPPVRPPECLVIEDSRAGIRAALAAGMWVVGLATTYPADQLAEAHAVLPGLTGASLDRLHRLFQSRDSQIL